MNQATQNCREIKTCGRESNGSNVLDQALGSAMEQPETGNLPLEPEDILLLSTDGFHNLVPPKDSGEVLAVQPDLKKVTEARLKQH
jgi:serine/threonine protein phosphatase PrpC